MSRTKVFDEQEVLEKAMNLFWQKGYNATSAQDLVDELCISRSSLYDTYRDKRSLFIKVLLQYRKEWIDPMIQKANIVVDAEEYIRELFSFIKKETFDVDGTRGCFWVNTAMEMGPVDPEVAEIVMAIMHDTENAFYKAIRKGQQQGVFSTQHTARSLARFVFNAISGLRVSAKLDTSERIFDDVIKICLSAMKV